MAEGKEAPELSAGQKFGCALVALIMLAVLVQCVSDAGGDDADNPAADGGEAIETSADWARQVTYYRLSCDLSGSSVGRQLTALGDGSGSALEGYRAAKEMEENCGGAWMAIDDIQTPDVDSSIEDLIEEAVETCRTEMWLSKEVGVKAQELFDGNIRPSVMAGMEEDLTDARDAKRQCDDLLDRISPRSSSDEPSE